MKRALLAVMVLMGAAAMAQTPQAPASATSPLLQKKIEAYLRKLYAWGPSFAVKVGALSDAPVAGFYEVRIEVTLAGQSDSAVLYVSHDGRYLLRGDLHNLDVDPFAAARKQMKLEGQPAKGPPDAKVVVIAYSDFQCPHCRELAQTLKAIIPLYPQVRFVFKDFPLEQIHPWAMTAHTAARCAYQQNPDAFWQIHDLIFENQDSIKPDNAWQTMLDYTARFALDPQAFRTCMVSDDTKQAILANSAEARSLAIANTPTVFVNGRRLVGGDRGLLEQYINYELGAASGPPRPQKP